MNRQQNQRNITGIILWILLIVSVVISLLIGYRFFQLSQLVPNTDGLEQVRSDIYPFDPESMLSADPEIDLPIDTELEIQIVFDYLGEKASLLNSEYLDLSAQVGRLRSSISGLIFIQLFFILFLFICLGFGIFQTRKLDLTIREYRNLRSMYQKLLGSKKIVDAELRAARDYISELEDRLQEK